MFHCWLSKIDVSVNVHVNSPSGAAHGRTAFLPFYPGSNTVQSVITKPSVFQVGQPIKALSPPEAEIDPVNFCIHHIHVARRRMVRKVLS